MSSFRILVINPGSTSTKIGMFHNERPILEETIRHDEDELCIYTKVIEQYEFRKSTILEVLDAHGMNLSKIDAVCARGGLLRPIEGGTYVVNEEMLQDLRDGYNGHHASNLGGILAHEIAVGLNIPAFIVDPVVVDELSDLARISGFAGMERKSIFHALNQKSVARRVAKDRGVPYEALRLIVAHLGGGITVGVHEYGKVVDVNNGLDGEGPFSPERAGTVPAGQLVAHCFSGRYNESDMMRKLVGQGGLAGLLGTNDAIKVEGMIAAGDERAKLIYEAMAYQIAKEIGAASAVLMGEVDAIILTGGLAYSKRLVGSIQERVHWIADVIVHPGEDELRALAEGTLRVLRKEEQAKQYVVREHETVGRS